MIHIYAPVFILFGLGLFLSVALLGLSYLRAPRKPSKAKRAPYECGFDPFDENTSRKQFSVHFYLVSILFIIFDVEIAFLFPWAISLKDLGVFGFVSMMIFLFVLTLGFIYEWKKGALEWN